ncbi:MAG: maltose alpha-D-glucosyltransferase [Cyclobacteriaceae bacterium]
MIDKSEIEDNTLWYKDAIIYELHIKAFYDSNGDGIGDFKGLLEKLDYLEDLGVTAIWLLPFYPSPLRDDGYDIADYYSINKTYGDISIFKQFIKEAHKRGLKVITELVINHTSDQHPWFQRARKAKPGSAFRNYYVWSEDPSKYKEARIIFTDTEPSNWSWDPVAKSYYWHRFFSHQPDLNFDNPQVQKEVFKIMEYWLKMGVDGFRLDAVPYLFERDGTNCENLPETHQFLKDLRAQVEKKFSNKLLLAEANMWPEDSAAYFGNGDECQMNYHFPIMPRMFMAVKMEDRYPITDIIDQTPDIPDSCQWAIFLRNHDELTLEMVTDEERDYMYKMYTKDSQAKINVGIRHRLAPLLENSRTKIELMNLLLFSLPGTPVIYYGDELGMGDNFYLGDRDGVRTPMQWNANKNAGFSDANPHKLYLPVIIDPEYRFESINVEAQQVNSSSLLWWMKRIINMRKQYKAFGRGNISFLSPANPKVIAFTRIYEDEIILVLANLSRFSQAAELELEAFEDYFPMEMFSHNKFPRITERPYLFTLGPHGYYWLVLQKEQDFSEDRAKQPLIKLDQWEELFSEKNLQKLERKLLPSYIKECRWFGGKSRIIKTISLRIVAEIGEIGLAAKWTILDIQYTEGSSEKYQLPLGFVQASTEDDLSYLDRRGIIGKLAVGEMEGYLIDAVYDETFRNAIFAYLKKGRKIKVNSDQLMFQARPMSPIKSDKEIQSKILSAEQSNTSIIYNGKYFMKLYRKVDNTINPDVEITRFLTEKAHFKNVPNFLGEISLLHKDKTSTVLAMVQEAVPNQGDAWEYIKDSLHIYFEKVQVLPKTEKIPEILSDITTPIQFSETPELIQNLMGVASERILLLGKRTGEMHQALVSISGDKEFGTEGFSLHYQRSLYSSLQSLTRGSFQSLKQNLKNLAPEIRVEAEEVLQMKDKVLKVFKRIFDHKITTLKIRNHGDYHLGQVLWTGKDFIIIDFEGEPAREYSERRLKRSPLRDIAGMIRSFHYAAYSTLLKNEFNKDRKDDDLEGWSEVWYRHITGIYLQGYLDQVDETNLMPKENADFKILLETFLLEKAVYELNYELNNRPDWVLIPLRGIKTILTQYKDE